MLSQLALEQKDKDRFECVALKCYGTHNNLPEQIRNAQVEACKEENIGAEGFRGEGEPFEVRSDGTKCLKGRHDLKKLYWWPNMKADIATYVNVIVKVGKFHFLADFVVVDYDVDPRVPLILGRPFLRTAHALVDVFGEELILRVGDEKLIFHADNTSKHPQKHTNESINMINFIDITCEDRFLEVLKKSTHPSSGSNTPLSNSLPSITPFETSDSLLEEFADKLALLDPFLWGIGDADFDSEGDILLLKKLLNDDPSSPLPPKELNFEELKMIKYSMMISPPLYFIRVNL
ncbi:reverse transcriptase domain-containing protein [Tanacetum coccineum]|uniref:Reverse transcriptase domain-containing protein n=1 Tax=Tanacetum coccineum TaxID=301880 RepID=A0ABQ5H6M5_9ASTR